MFLFKLAMHCLLGLIGLVILVYLAAFVVGFMSAFI